MADPAPAPCSAAPSRKAKRKAMKKEKRKQVRRECATRAREEEEAKENDPEEREKALRREQDEAEEAEKARREFEDRERAWLAAAEARRAREEAEEEERQQKLLERCRPDEEAHSTAINDDDDDQWEYVDEGPAEIIWGEKEIIVKKKRVKVLKKSANQKFNIEDENRPTSNPFPPLSDTFAAIQSAPAHSMQELLENAAQQTPNFGTEQDKAHCPFHLKTGACRFGIRCSRVHFYPDKSCTLLIKNMYNGPGLAWEQDEGLEYTDEEIDRAYEEFYEDVHTEFLKFGEIVNFKVCRNGSFHLRGNVYIHYKSIGSAVLAYNFMNGRYFAGKQIACEFVGVLRWKVAICGEFMKSRYKTCSHGTACNFLHCFQNPGGDYEWADWDRPPPKYWVKKMVVLFGPSDDIESTKCLEFEHQEWSDSVCKREAAVSKRHGRLSLRKSHDRDRDNQYAVIDEDYSDGYRWHHHSHSGRREKSSKKKSKDYVKSSAPCSSEKYGSRSHGSIDKISESERQSGVKDEENQSDDCEDCGGVYKCHTRRSSSKRAGENSLSDYERHDMIQYHDRYAAEDVLHHEEEHADEPGDHNDSYLFEKISSKATVTSCSRQETPEIVGETGSAKNRSVKNGRLEFKEDVGCHIDDFSRYTPIPTEKEDEYESLAKFNITRDRSKSTDCIEMNEKSSASGQRETYHREKTKRKQQRVRSESEETCSSDEHDNRRHKVRKHHSRKEKHDRLKTTFTVKESSDPVKYQSLPADEHRKQSRSLMSSYQSSSSSRRSSKQRRHSPET